MDGSFEPSVSWGTLLSKLPKSDRLELFDLTLAIVGIRGVTAEEAEEGAVLE